MPDRKLCFRCHGKGTKFGGTCFRCNGTGIDPGSPPQAHTSRSAEDLLGLSEQATQSQNEPLDLSGSSEQLAILKGRLAALSDQVARNQYTQSTNTAKLETQISAIQNLTTREIQSARTEQKDFIHTTAKLIEDLTSLINTTRPVEITLNNTLTGESTTLPNEHRHPTFSTLLRAAASRQSDGFHPNIWVAGPAGSGKTTGGRQLARALNLPFFFNGAVNMEHKLIGFRDATGQYHETPFRQGYTVPAVYQFDDVDSSDNSALLALNAALANGECDFADKLMPRHPDSIILATANTWGLGATSEYVGRVKIDAAFLSRFPVKIQWPYDEPFEITISGNPAWAKRVQTARHTAASHGLKVIIDPRHTIAGAALIQSGFTPDQAAELTYLASLPADKRSLLQ